MTVNKTCLSYWFPLIEAAGLPVPKTTIIRVEDSFKLMALLGPIGMYGEVDGVTPLEVITSLATKIKDAAELYGYPVFLRTGQTSGKHYWKDTCFLEKSEDVNSHMFELVQYSEMASLMGMPYDVWVVREFLKTKTVAYAYHGMPVNREFRFFVTDDHVDCYHPYWPLDALLDGGASLEIYDDLCALPPAGLDELTLLASMAGTAVGGGSWSVDLLETENGWFLTDMAEAKKSFHWESCQHVDRYK